MTNELCREDFVANVEPCRYALDIATGAFIYIDKLKYQLRECPLCAAGVPKREVRAAKYLGKIRWPSDKSG